MASCRGLFPPSMRPLLARPLRTAVRSPTLHFSTSPIRQRVANQKPSSVTIKTTPTAAVPRRAPAPSGQPAAGQSSYALVKSLASKPTPTILYEAPSHFWFYFGCWTSGGLILTWTLVTGPTVAGEQPEGVAPWVGWVYTASYALLGAMGFYLISKTPSIIRTIRVIPRVSGATTAAATTSPAAAAAVKSAAVAAAPALDMEITVRRALPLVLRKPKVLTVPLDDVSLASRLSLPEESVPRLRRVREEQERRAAVEQHRADMQRILTMPFRQLSRALVGLFEGVRAAWTDMGFGVVRVGGKAYKIDVTQGFAHDGFKTLERIVRIEA